MRPWALVAALLLLGAAATTATGQDPPAGGGLAGADSAAERARIRAAAAEAGDAPPPPPLPGATPGDPGAESALGTPTGAPGAPPAPPGAPGGEGAVEGRDTVLDADAPTLVQILKERAAKLAARKAELDQEEARLKALRADVAARFVELTALRDALDERMATFGQELDARRDEQLNKLVKAMQGMPPEAAADMCVEMDEGVVVRAFNRMKARNVAKVLAAMPPPLAARVAQRLALLRQGLDDKRKEAKK